MIKNSEIPEIVITEIVFKFGGLITKAQARALIGHGLRAWPEVWTSKEMIGGQPYLLLPLPQEKQND